MPSPAWRRCVPAAQPRLPGGSGVEVGSAQRRGWQPTARGPLVAGGPAAPPGPGDYCSARPVAPAGPTSSAPAWGKMPSPGSAATAATRAAVRGAAGGAGSPGPRGHRSHLGPGERRRAVMWGGREGAWQGLVLIISLPLEVPPWQPAQGPAPLVQGPSHRAAAPGTLAEEEEARILAGHPDTQLPSQPLSRKPEDPHE